MHNVQIDHAAAVEAERGLLEPAIRSDRAAVEALLHPDFTEIGASGRFWQRAEIIDAITTDEHPHTPEATAFEATTIAPDTVLLTYTSAGTRHTRRSSIWQRVDDTWKIRFHQGTPAEPPRSPSDAWDAQVAAVWASAETLGVDGVRERIDTLSAERPDEARALFEAASVHDYAGEEATAIGLYERALDGDLDDERRQRAMIQLASSLRNVGRPEDAVALLASGTSGEYAVPASGFLALALADTGRDRDAVRTVIGALASTNTPYARALGAYASELP